MPYAIVGHGHCPGRHVCMLLFGTIFFLKRINSVPDGNDHSIISLTVFVLFTSFTSPVSLVCRQKYFWRKSGASEKKSSTYSLGWTPSHSIHLESSTTFVCPPSYQASNFVTRLDPPWPIPSTTGPVCSKLQDTEKRISRFKFCQLINI